MEKLNKILADHVVQQQGRDTKDKLLGAAFTVVNADGILYQGAAGRIDLALDSKPWGPNTLSWIASMTKLASAISILQIVEKGLVTLDEDLRSKIPFLNEVEIIKGFDNTKRKPILEPNTSPITLRHLLTHTSGLAYDLTDELLMKWRRAVGKDLINMTWTLEGFSTPLLFPPGTDWSYGTGIDWATLLLEQVTGTKLSMYMSEHIFDPLGMTSTGFWPAKLTTPQPLAAIPNRDHGGGLVPAPSPTPDEHPVESGGAGLFSTTADYSKLLRAVLRGELLSAESMELLFKPQLSGDLLRKMDERVRLAREMYAPEYAEDTPMNFALGGMLNTADVPGKRTKGSMMWSGYTNPHWWVDRERGVAGVLQVSLLPFGDPVVAKLYDALERTVYGDLIVEGAGKL
ncbi:hypothetical protein N0V93_000341 [Gnomoniopsis smithogilvyi]|uniref:Beta-lactamase-related domain-containing protein n=1 Tax=Gnomoniopsis smithogilvyi TaxID=1191159 RepID=A0A9W9D1A0_9PEZI|nr:hypothetical protein N0V93_000341 [Gnomoniopsis smithogilvyi]